MSVRRVSMSRLALMAMVATVAIVVPAPAAPSAWAAQERRYQVTGMVLRVEREARRFTVSHEDIPGLMSGMVMPFEVHSVGELAAVAPGALVEFTLVIGPDAGYATAVRVRQRADARAGSAPARAAIGIGARLPDATFVDQLGRRVAFPRDVAGRVAVLDFIYTRCALPQYCARQSQTFAALQKRFARQYGDELVLLSVTFDPEHDTPDVLASYAARYGADPKMWRFLTGRASDVGQFGARAGVGRYPDEGMTSHSSRTIVIDRGGRVAAVVDGNQYPVQQMGDLVLDLVGPLLR